MDHTASTPRQLALVLRGRRQALRVTQAIAAARIGLLPKTVSALESRPERCQVASLFKLLAALELELVLRPKARHPISADDESW